MSSTTHLSPGQEARVVWVPGKATSIVAARTLKHPRCHPTQGGLCRTDTVSEADLLTGGDSSGVYQPFCSQQIKTTVAETGGSFPSTQG